MMSSPQTYYEMHLKGKNEKEIRSVICELKREIRHLKNIMEHPEYGSADLSEPTEEVRIWCTRLYLERAIEAMSEIGSVHIPSREERTSRKFQENIDHIKRIRLEIGGFHEGYATYIITIDEEHIYFDVEHSLYPKPICLPEHMPNTIDYPMPKYEFLEELRELYIGEWRRSYTPQRFGEEYTIDDGMGWSVDIEFSNGTKTVHYEGTNSVPYNFKKFERLFGIEE